ncbi:hypothetical protein GQ85_03460 [Rhodococcus rhodochrous]|nr:hypothetical protein GQ85_03460 [Rhodococcus rhodochrous]
MVFEHVLAPLVHGSVDERNLRRRLAERSAKVIGLEVPRSPLSAYDRPRGLDLKHSSVDG